MNKSVPSHWAIIIVLVVAVALGAYAWVKSNSIGSGNSPVTHTAAADNQKAGVCAVHAYEGKADVRVWQAQKDGKNVLEVESADVSKLPNSDCAEFKLADATPALQKKLAASSEKNPVAVTVTGFMTRCNNQTAVAVTNYKQGVFKPYL